MVTHVHKIVMRRRWYPFNLHSHTRTGRGGERGRERKSDPVLQGERLSPAVLTCRRDVRGYK